MIATAALSATVLPKLAPTELSLKCHRRPVARVQQAAHRVGAEPGAADLRDVSVLVAIWKL
jgi:hypothetical protein